MLLLLSVSFLTTAMSFKFNRFNTITTIKKINKIRMNCDCGSDSSSDCSSDSSSYSSSNDNYYSSDYSSDNNYSSDYGSDNNVFFNSGSKRKRSSSSDNYVKSLLNCSMLALVMSCMYIASQIKLSH